jgi:hypothetical protein
MVIALGLGRVLGLSFRRNYECPWGIWCVRRDFISWVGSSAPYCYRKIEAWGHFRVR